MEYNRVYWSITIRETIFRGCMMNETTVILSPKQHPARVDLLTRLQVVRDSYLNTMSPNTRRAYIQDLLDFSKFMGEEDPNQALRRLMENGPGEANATALQYKAELINRGLKPSTVNRWLYSIRSSINLARMSGFIVWGLEVSGVKTKPYRDTTGPGREGYLKLLETTDSSRPREIRDRAIIHLLYDRALRRGEVVRMDLEDADLKAGTISIISKGKREPETLEIPEETVNALQDWIRVRGDEPGPLFQNFDRAGKGDGRLTADGIYKMILYRARLAGITARPHGLRHTAITRALELTGGNLPAVQDFSRHAKTETLRIYDDNRNQRGGKVAQMVAIEAAL